MSAPLPPNEAQRLQVLRDYAILDTPPEVAFERVSALAAQFFNAPIALVSLVDMDRQWFKACFGVDMRETSRELSFCAYAILSDEVMVVSDTLDDPRFKNNPLVTASPFVRFYAGAPLKTPSGHNLGSLCILDVEPRTFSREQQGILADLSAMVVSELDLRRTARELRDERIALVHSEERFRQLAENISDTFWMISPEDQRVEYVSAAYETIWGRSIEELKDDPNAWLQSVHPEDRDQVQQSSGTVKTRGGFVDEYRIVRPDGGIRWVRSRGFPIADAEGKVYRIAGISEDVTPLKKAEEELRQAKAATEEANLALEERVRERTAELAHSQIEILTRLARAAEYRDDDTGQHTKRVAHTAALLAQTLGLPEEQVDMMRQAAPLHDVGKIAVSDLILLKPGKLTNEEFELMKSHASIGASMLCEGTSQVIHMAERIAGSHHERWDGTGYPSRLAGEEIPLEGRILAIADVFDALTHDRPYKTAWPVSDAVAEITRQSEKQFDPQVVQAFLTLPHEELI